MKRFAATLILAVLALTGFTLKNPFERFEPHYVKYVNTFVGTDFHGHTFPGAAYPFGMMQISPDTRTDNWDGCSGYHYSDSTIWGFSHTHLSGTGCADWCDILLMPVSGFEKVAESDVEAAYPDDFLFTEYYQSPFSHENEYSTPGYYSVILDKWGVKAEMSAGKRAGMHRCTWQEGVAPQIIIDLEPRDNVLDSQIEIAGRSAIQGFRRSRSWSQDQIVYFYMEFSKPIKSANICNAESDFGAKALISFVPAKRGDNEIVMKVSISSVSEENARLNLLSETKRKSFFAFCTESAKAWEKYLSKIEVEGSDEDMKTFYSALYHTAVSPCLYSDVNGEYRGMDRKVHKAEGFERYTVFSLWDTFRSLHPLLNLIERERTVDFLKTFQSIFDEGGKLPMWELSGYETNCMIGYNSAPVVADALAKGISGFDREAMLKALVATSNKSELGIDIYRDNGLVLSEKEHESVSKTLEYANDDWCIAQVAKASREAVSDKRWCDSVIAAYTLRAKYYRNVFDPESGFMRPRISGIWLKPFNPSEVNVHYTEANSWQYSFHVQQDISGLIDLEGGPDAFEHRLDDLFAADSKLAGWNSADMTGMIGQYVQGNEPSHHIAYLYPYVGKPYKTQKVVRQIMSELFSSAPDGLCGNEDCGQMSAWYVLSSLGFYPVTPGSDLFVFGSPLWRSAVINLENGTKFTILAPENNEKNIYVKSVRRDEVPYGLPYMRFSDIEAGSTFQFEMASEPNKSFGAEQALWPVSSIEAEFVENPWFEVERTMFKAFTPVQIKALKPEYKIMYRILEDVDNEGGKRFIAEEPFKEYEGVFTIKRNCTLEAYCENAEGMKSFITRTRLYLVSATYDVQIKSKYSRQYNGGGDDALIDNVRGQSNFRLGGWQGYQDTDFEAVIDLKQTKHLTELGAGFLQDAKSWIWMPKYVEFYTSLDGKTYHFAGRVSHDVDEQDMTPQIHDLMVKIVDDDAQGTVGRDARYVKVFAKNIGTIPSWHPGAGGEGYIFIDEVLIK
jgi:alpha-1,2-mannosidase, putative